MSVNEMLMAAAGSAGGDVNYIDDCFATHLYTGNGSTQTITNGIDLAGEGGMVWRKRRDATANHFIADTVRGTYSTLSSNTTDAASGSSYIDFLSDGFQAVNSDSSNSSGSLQCSWSFRKAPKFFDVVTYTGNGSNRTIAHNLGSVPGMIIIKRTDASSGWLVYHRSTGNSQFLSLNTTSGAASDGGAAWNSTTPTSSVFSLGTAAGVNTSGGTYVAYIFAHDAGGFGESGTDNVISCGSFTTSGALASVNLGYEPQYVLIKRTDNVEDWLVSDVMRGMPVGSADNYLRPNSSAAEVAYDYIDPTATGFNIKGLATAGTYIYMAIRRPMKPPTSGTEVFNVVAFSGNGGSGSYSNGFPTDLAIHNTRNTTPTYQHMVYDRLRGRSPMLRTALTDAELGAGFYNFDQQNSLSYAGNVSGFNSSSETYVDYNFRRATGFFDIVCYTGTGSVRTVAHNLGVAPELMIVKARNTTGNWGVYAAPITPGVVLNLNRTDAEDGGTNYWNNTVPTATQLTVSSAAVVNGSGNTYVAYLFASVAGVSKVGSYTGNGSSQTINCGFTAGARFVMVKATSTTGDWVIVDTARGLVSGNDPFLELNTTAAEQTGQDILDPDSSGFVVNQTTESINASGVSYIYLAIS